MGNPFPSVVKGDETLRMLQPFSSVATLSWTDTETVAVLHNISESRLLAHMAHEEIRVDVLKRLAEQAMSDSAFRAAAAQDLDAALGEYGYVLNGRETDLVHRFRTTLADAGVDLMLAKNMDLDSLFDDATGDDVERLLDE
jgi:hypothetical protein